MDHAAWEQLLRRRGAQALRSAAARLGGLAARVDGAPGATADNRSRYRDVWRPGTALEARRLIAVMEDEEYFERTGREEADRLLPWVRAESTVLDLGCGMGRIAKYVAPHCATLWAADVSEEMLRFAADRLSDCRNVRFAHSADSAVPEVPDGSIDFAYSVLVLQHVEREDAFLLMRDVHRMLRPGGSAFVTWPNITEPFYLDTFVKYAETGEVANPARARIYTTIELETVLARIGFSAVEVQDAPNIVTVCTR